MSNFKMTFYRKYRSQTLDELIGQNLVKNTLKAAFDAGKLAHAYLFCGPRGTGKTSTARILAKMINCEKVDNQKLEGINIPCNKCASCLSITDGTNLDVIEMDAASNRGIDDIRNLKDTIKLAPTASRKKVYIIDEVHMLSGDAFNAFLKTLEEPPSHVLFIMATTEPQKIPATILSRVVRVDFKPATTSESAELIRKVAKAEKIEIEEEAVLSLAKKASGSFRDAVKFLDQLSSFGKIDNKVVLDGLGSGDFDQTINLLENVSLGDPSKVLDSLNDQLEAGVNIKELTLTLMDILREIIFIKNDLGEKLVKSKMDEEKYQKLSDLAEKLPPERIILIINNLQTSLEQARYTSIASLPLEIALVESCTLASQGVSLQGCNDQRTSKREKLDDENLKLDEEAGSLELGYPVSNIQPPSSNGDLLKIQEKWSYILETIKAYNYSLEALLRSSKILECGENSIVIEVPYSFHQRILESAKSRDLLESVFSDVLERQVKIATALGKRPAGREDLSNIEVAADDEIVKIASEIFNSEIVN